MEGLRARLDLQGVTFAAGLEEEVFRLDEHFYDPGYAVVDAPHPRLETRRAWGPDLFYGVLQNSCNPGFISIGLRLGKESFSNTSAISVSEKRRASILLEKPRASFSTRKIGMWKQRTRLSAREIP